MSLKILSPVAAAALIALAPLQSAWAIDAAPVSTTSSQVVEPAAARAPAGAARSQEAQLQELQSTNEFQRRALAQLHERVAAAEDLAAWMPWLGGGLLLSLGLAGVLAWRLWSVQRDVNRREAERFPQQPLPPSVPVALGTVSPPSVPMSDSSWRQGGAPTSGQMSTAAGLAPIATVAANVSAGLAAARVSDTEPAAIQSRVAATVATAPLPSLPPGRSAPSRSAVDAVFGAGGPGRAVSAEELLDLEQQVDFFVVLGQQDSAIDLLVSHIRATGGTSALPYLKLLEIYQRQDNAEDYERTRSRFNQRFSAEAPAWGGDLTKGRDLQAYPDVIQRLQALWPMPGEAQRELGVFMHLSERGHIFDLPAFRDLLLLHGVAADLLAHAPAEDLDSVDILLPITDEPMDVTAPQPRLSSRPIGLQMMMPRPPEDLLADAPRTAQAAIARLEAHRAASVRVDTTIPEPPPAVAPARSLSIGGGRAAAAVQASLAQAAAVAERPIKLDLDLSEYAPAPRDFTQPAAFTDINLYRDPMNGGDGSMAGDRTPTHANGVKPGAGD